MTKKEWLTENDGNINNPIGVLSLCGEFGILILDYDHDIDDSVFWRYSNETKIKKSVIKYSYDGNDNYINTRFGRIHFSEIMRV